MGLDVALMILGALLVGVFFGAAVVGRSDYHAVPFTPPVTAPVVPPAGYALQVGRLRVESGDTVLVRVPFEQTTEQRAHLSNELGAGFPDGVRVLVLPFRINIEATIGRGVNPIPMPQPGR